MSKQIVNTPNAPAAIGPYSQAVKCGNFLFVSGQIPIDPATGTLINGSIEDETHRVMKNLNAILEEAGSGFVNVLKATIFIKNMNDFARINEVYASYFSGNYPARETVEVARLPKNVNVEISVIAVV
ncbi:MAG: RidA family protein [Chitinophagales bacterium]|nr:RidA family protein [Chitinophagales bacterium]